MKYTPTQKPLVIGIFNFLLVLCLFMPVLSYAQTVNSEVKLNAVASPSPAQANPIRIQDDSGKTVVLNKSPQRIVSILPSLTETICELGYCQRLVGVDRYSIFPASLQNLPQLGGGLDPNIEAIVALKPDVVVMAASSRAGERLRALGLNVVALEPKTHADVQRVMRLMAQALDVPVAESDRAWRHIDAAVNAAAQSIPAQAKGQLTQRRLKVPG